MRLSSIVGRLLHSATNFSLGWRLETLRPGEADVPQAAVLDLGTSLPPDTALNLVGLAFVSDYIVS